MANHPDKKYIIAAGIRFDTACGLTPAKRNIPLVSNYFDVVTSYSQRKS